MARKTHTEAQLRYDKVNRRVYGFRLHNDIDSDIIAKLASVDSMQGYIKQLIREDIARTRIDSVPENKNNMTEEKTMKTYRIKPEYIDLFGADATAETVLTEPELKDLAASWEKPFDEILEQVYPNTPKEVSWYTRT